MAAMDGIMKSVCPAYGTIQKGMKMISKQDKPKPKNKPFRLTTISQGSGKPVLAAGVTVNQAAKKLYEFEQLEISPYEIGQIAKRLADFEELGLSPYEVSILIAREKALTNRVKKLEGWEDGSD
jgi:hypothetical protein